MYETKNLRSGWAIIVALVLGGSALAGLAWAENGAGISGFYHYSVPSTDTTGVAQRQGGYILVGNPPASFTKTGDNTSDPQPASCQ